MLETHTVAPLVAICSNYILGRFYINLFIGKQSSIYFIY